MYKNLMQRLGRRDEEGFTLIELMVVVLIIAILMAIAIPTFLSARGNAQAKAAESNIRNALTDEQTYFTGPGGGTLYGTSAQMTSAAVDNSINWVGSPTSLAAGDNSVSVVVAADTSNNSEVTLAAEGGNHDYYWALDDNGAVTYAVTTSATPPSSITASSWTAAEQAAA
jgi:type IV pilus assembly protein PilA